MIRYFVLGFLLCAFGAGVTYGRDIDCAALGVSLSGWGAWTDMLKCSPSLDSYNGSGLLTERGALRQFTDKANRRQLYLDNTPVNLEHFRWIQYLYFYPKEMPVKYVVIAAVNDKVDCTISYYFLDFTRADWFQSRYLLDDACFDNDSLRSLRMTRDGVSISFGKSVSLMEAAPQPSVTYFYDGSVMKVSIDGRKPYIKPHHQ